MQEGCDLEPVEEIAEICTDHFTRGEIRKVISKLKSGKSPGIDNLNAEMLKASPDKAIGHLLNIMNKILDTCLVPLDWKKSLLVKIPKKGDVTICDNNRGISLLSIAYKVFCR
mgnify:CR=1 FL=1